MVNKWSQVLHTRGLSVSPKTSRWTEKEGIVTVPAQSVTFQTRSHNHTQYRALVKMTSLLAHPKTKHKYPTVGTSNLPHRLQFHKTGGAVAASWRRRALVKQDRGRRAAQTSDSAETLRPSALNNYTVSGSQSADMRPAIQAC